MKTRGLGRGVEGVGLRAIGKGEKQTFLTHGQNVCQPAPGRKIMGKYSAKI